MCRLLSFLIVFLLICVFQLYAEESKTFTFVQMCDTQLGMGEYEKDVSNFKQAVKQINAIKPDMVFICGDLVNKADDKSFKDFNDIKSGFMIPCHCAAGNHDVENKPNIASLMRYRQQIGKDYYTVKHKSFSFIITNTQLWKAPLAGETEKHDSWVKDELKKAKAESLPIFIVGHYPLYITTPDEKESYYNFPLDKRQELLDLYKEHGVVAVIAGHTHKTIINNYEGIQLVNGEVTSKNFDKRPLGFRLWTVTSADNIKHEFVQLEGP